MNKTHSKPIQYRTPKVMYRFFLFLILSSILSTNIYAFCIFGIGTTCTTTPTSGLGGFFQGLVDIGSNIYNSIFKPTPVINPDSINSFENLYKDNIIGDDESIGKEINLNYDGGNLRGRVKKLGKSQVISQEQALWFDLDLVSSEIICVGCLSDEIEAGHTLNIYYSIKNYGNILNTNKFNLDGKIITPDSVIPLNYDNINAYITGDSEFEFVEPIPRFGLDSKGNIKPWALGAGYINLTLELEITNDHSVEYAGVQQILTPKQIIKEDPEKFDKCIDDRPNCVAGMTASECASFIRQWEKSCHELAKTILTYQIAETKYSCPDGTETIYTDGHDCKVEELGQENKLSNKISVQFPIKKLSAPLEGQGGLGIFG